MHSTIFQVSKTKMEEDDHLSVNDIADYDYGTFGIDYIGDEREDEEGFNMLENSIPGELFTVNRNTRTITVNRDKFKLVLRRMVNAIRVAANNLNSDNITNWKELYMLQKAVENYLGNDALFHFEGETLSLNNFIRDIANDDCTTLYIGAMLDYHF